MRRALAFGLCLWGAGLLLGEVAAAQGRVVVMPFQGRMSRRLRAEIVSAVSNNGMPMLPQARVRATADDAGFDLDDATGREAVAGELQIRAYVFGRSKKRGSRITLTVRVFDGMDGELLGETELTGRRKQIRKVVKRQAWRRIRKWINASAAPDAPPDAPQGDYGDYEDEDPPGWGDGDSSRSRDDRRRRRSGRRDDRRDRGVGRSTDDYDDSVPEDFDDVDEGASDMHAFDLAVGMQFVTRNYDYNEPLVALAFANVPLSPVLRVQAHWYPGVHAGAGPATYFGLDVAYSHWLGGSANRDGETFDVSASAYRIGLRARLPIGDHELGLAAGWAALQYEIADSQGGENAGLPGVSYGFLRVGPDLRLAFGAAAVELEAAYLHPLKFGNIASTGWFPRTTGVAIDAAVRVSYGLVPEFEVFGGVTFRQVGLTFNPEPEDEGAMTLFRVAGGAVDRYWGPEFGLRLRI